MTDEHAAIARAFEPADLEPLLADVRRRADRPRPERRQRRRHRLHVRVAGDVAVGRRRSSPGAGSTTRPSRGARLDELPARPKLRGIRHLIHQEPDPHWILRPTVEPAWRCSRSAGSCSSCRRSSRTISTTCPSSPPPPGLTLVVDHLGKPPLGTDEMAAVGGAAAGGGRAAERRTQRSPASTRVAPPATGARTTSSPRSTSPSTRSARRGSCAGATGRSRC